MPEVRFDANGLPLFDQLYRWGYRQNGDRPGESLEEIGPGLLDCAQTALERLYKQFEQGPNWQALMGLLSDVFAPLELEIGRVGWLRYVSTATGRQLEEIGALIGRDRGGLVDDEIYRAIILADAATLITDATPEDMISIMSRLSGQRLVEILEHPDFPAYFEVRVRDAGLISSGVWPVLIDVISDMPPAGVQGLATLVDPLASGGWSTTYGDTYSEAWWGTSHDAEDAYALAHWSHVREI